MPKDYSTACEYKAAIEEDCWFKQHDPITSAFLLSKFYSCSFKKGTVYFLECFITPLISLSKVKWYKKENRECKYKAHAYDSKIVANFNPIKWTIKIIISCKSIEY